MCNNDAMATIETCPFMPGHAMGMPDVLARKRLCSLGSSQTALPQFQVSWCSLYPNDGQ